LTRGGWGGPRAGWRCGVAAGVRRGVLSTGVVGLCELAALQDHNAAGADRRGQRGPAGPGRAVAAGGWLVDYLRDRQLLLVLDNCEHLADQCASLAARAAPRGAGLADSGHQPARRCPRRANTSSRCRRCRCRTRKRPPRPGKMVGLTTRSACSWSEPTLVRAPTSRSTAGNQGNDLRRSAGQLDGAAV